MLSVRFTDERRLAPMRGAAARPGPARLLDVEPEPDRLQRAVVLTTSRLVLTSWRVDDVESLRCRRPQLIRVEKSAGRGWAMSIANAWP